MSIGDSVLTGLMATLNTAVAAVPSFATAAPSVIASVQQPLSLAQSRVQQLIDAGEAILGSVTTFGGVLPSASIGESAANLLAQSANLAQLSTLYQLTSILGRMAANLAAVTASPKSITVAGGNLFQLSEQQYGDAMDWTSIAKANGLTDPFIDGVQTLNIPAQPDNAGGVLSS